MKNKQKMWRKMAAKQYDGASVIRNGRQLRDMIRNSFANQQGILTTPLLKLFKLAGIDTPVYDAQMASYKASMQRKEVVATNNQIEDAVIINEGVPSAA